MIYYISKQTSMGINTCSVEFSITELNKLDWVSVDTETTGLDRFQDRLWSIQLGNGINQFVVDLITIPLVNYKELLSIKNLIFQNAKFDLQFLYVNNIVPRGKIWDTMLAEQVLTNGLETPANLKYIVEKYCGVILDKTERNNLIRRGFTYDTIVYGAKDIEYLEKVMILQTQDALKKDVLLAIKLENEFVKALAYTEYCGLFLDIEKWRTKYQSAGLVLEEVEKELDIWIINSPYKHYIDTQLDFFTQYVEGKPIFTKTLINWSSSQQVKELFKEIGIKVIDTSNKGKSGESISKNILEMQKNAFDIIPIYLKYQNIKKDFSTYGESFLKYINPVTGRIHCEFNQLMSTGRLSSTKPNLQNLPSDERTRSCFVAEEGNILVDADYSA